MKKIEWPTALVVVAGIAAVSAMAALHVDANAIAAVASAVIALAGALRQLVATGDDGGAE